MQTFLYIFAFGLVSITNQSKPALESFIEQPPVIREVLFSTAHATNEDVRYYFGKWQSNAFFLREISSLSEEKTFSPSPLANFVSKYEHHIWKFDELNGMTAYDDRQGSVVDIPAIEETLSLVLNAGVPNMPIGSINWTNDTFSVVSPMTGAQLSGHLNLDASGGPKSLDLDITAKGRVVKHRIEYEISAPNKDLVLPDTIACSAVVGNVWKRYRTLHIYKLHTQHSLLSEADFDLTPFAVANNSTRRGVTNGIWSYSDSNGVHVIRLAASPSHSSLFRGLFVGILLAVLAIGFLRIFKRSNTTINDQR